MLSTLWFYLKTWFVMDEEGQGMVEYGLILALVAVGVIIALGALGTDLSGLFQGIANKVGAETTTLGT
ncbi:MAG: Flp family type IVb pilin [Firmicutes bacterium]|nr:Flp family type IVb pilin [Bacillota bacterium]